MSNSTSSKLGTLGNLGANYFSWIYYAELHLQALNLKAAIQEGNDASPQDRAKALLFLHDHIDDSLKSEYLTVKDPFILWKSLKGRYEPKLLKAQRYWEHLRLQDFNSVSKYEFALRTINVELKSCGKEVTEKEKLEKTISTFHTSNKGLQQRYRERGFTRYSELSSCLLMDELNNKLVLKNHQSHPVGFMSFPGATSTTLHEHRQGHGRGCNLKRERDYSWRRAGYNHSQNRETKPYHQKGNNTRSGLKKVQDFQTKKTPRDVCRICGMKGHWSRTCPYKSSKSSIKAKGKDIEMNFSDSNETMGKTGPDFSDFHEGPSEKSDHLIGDAEETEKYFIDSNETVDIAGFDFSDFFEDPSGKIDHLIGDGNVYYD